MSSVLDDLELEEYYDKVFIILLSNYSKIVKSRQEEGARYSPQLDLLAILIWQTIATFLLSISSGVISNLISDKIQERFELVKRTSIKKDDARELVIELLSNIDKSKVNSISNSDETIVKTAALLQYYGWSKGEADVDSKKIYDSLINDFRAR